MELYLKKRNKIELNIAPLIDIVFLLLIFFMLANEFIDYKTIDMATPGTSEEITNTDKPIIVNLSKSGDIAIDDSPLNLLSLKKHLIEQKNINKTIKVIITTPQQTRISILIEVMDTIRLSGIDNIALSTEKE